VPLTRRESLVALSAAALGGRLMAQGADAYPQGAVRVVVPFAAGGATDVVARMLADKLAERLGQPFVIDNKAGAANVVGNQFVAKARPDGQTLLFAAAPLALNTALGMKLPYDPLKDFAPVSLVASTPIVIAVHPSRPWTTLKDIVVAAQAQPGGLSYATAGVGSMPHLLMESLRARSGAPLVHVGYKGAIPALQDALGGNVPLIADAYTPTGVQINAGKLRGIAVAARQRSPAMPQVATTAELGFPDLLGAGFYGLLAPAGTPATVIAKLHAAVTDAFRRSDIGERLVQQGYEVHASTPREYGDHLVREIQRWSATVSAAGVKAE